METDSSMCDVGVGTSGKTLTLAKEQKTLGDNILSMTKRHNVLK